MKEVCGDWRGDQEGDPKGWKHRNCVGETQCAGPKQLLPASSVYSRGLGSVRTGRIDNHRTGSQSDCLLEARRQELDQTWLQRVGSGLVKPHSIREQVGLEVETCWGSHKHPGSTLSGV